MLKRIALISLLLSLGGCIGPVVHQEKTLFRCSYRNTTTKKMYIFTSRDHFRALNKAHTACRKGPVHWRCYFDRCVQLVDYIR